MGTWAKSPTRGRGLRQARARIRAHETAACDAPPGAPGVGAGLPKMFSQLKHHRTNPEYSLFTIWDAVTLDADGLPDAAVKRYHVEWEATNAGGGVVHTYIEPGDPTNTVHPAIWRRTVAAKQTYDPDEKLHAELEDVYRPKDWYYRTRVGAEDDKGRTTFSNWTAPVLVATIARAAPPVPTATSIAVTATWEPAIHGVAYEATVQFTGAPNPWTLPDGDPQDDLKGYWVSLRYLVRNDASGAIGPLADGHKYDKAPNTQILRDFVKDRDQGSAVQQHAFHRLRHPTKFYVQYRLLSEDDYNRRSDYAPGTNTDGWSNPVLPGAVAEPVPPAPTGFTVLGWPDKHRKGQRDRLGARIQFNEISNWTYDTTTGEVDVDVFGYRVEWMLCDAAGNFLWDDPKHTFIDSKQDTDNNTTVTRVIHTGIHNGKKYSFRVKGRARGGHDGLYGPGGHPISGKAAKGWSALYTAAGKNPGKARNVATLADGNAVIVDWDEPDRFLGDLATNAEFTKDEIAWYEARVYQSDGVTPAVYPSTYPIVARRGQPVQDLQVLGTKKRFKVKGGTGGSAWSVAGGPLKGHVTVIGHADTSSDPLIDGTGTNPEPIYTTDGLAPSSSPAPTLTTPDRLMLRAAWAPIANADPVTYEVWYKAGSDFGTPGSIAGGTKAGEASADHLDAMNLTGGTLYYVRTVAKDADGSAAASTSASITVQSSHSDGTPPGSSPTPTIIGGPTFLYDKWTTLGNPDPATIEVHLSTSSGFTPTSGTKVKEVADVGSFIIKELPGGGALVYGTTYYVKHVAKDADGSAAASAQASGSLVQIGQTDIGPDSIVSSMIVAGTIVAADIAAGTITADRMNVTTLSAITADLGTITAGTITGATIQTSSSGTRVVIASGAVDRVSMYYSTYATQGGLLVAQGTLQVTPPYDTGGTQSSLLLRSSNAVSGLGIVISGGSSSAVINIGSGNVNVANATGDKLGFFAATAVVQPNTGIANATRVDNGGATIVHTTDTFGGYTIHQIVKGLQLLGLFA